MKKTIGNIIFYIFCIALIFVVLSQVGLLPFRFTYFLSGSMRPTFQPGDLAFMNVGSNLRVNSGDVILFSSDGYPTIHRAVNVENGVITTKGDANPKSDSEKITRVDGKLIFAIPKVGYLIDTIRISFENLGQWIQNIG